MVAGGLGALLGAAWVHASPWLATHFVPLLQPLPCVCDCGNDAIRCGLRVVAFAFNSLIGHPCTCPPF